MPRVCAAVLLLLLSVTGAARAQAPYVNRPLGFGLVPPAGWVEKKVADPTGEVAVIFAEPPLVKQPGPAARESDQEFLNRIRRTLSAPKSGGTGFVSNITVVTRALKAPVSVAQVAKDTRARAEEYNRQQRRRGSKAGHKFLAEKPRQLAGAQAIDRTLETTMRNQPTVRQREVMGVRGNRLYMITLTTLPASFDRLSGEFDKVINSFAWK